MSAEVAIAAATAADVDAIDEISRAAFASPWPKQTYVDELARPQAQVDVARVEGRVVGYVVTWTVLDASDLLVIATAPALRRRGVGRALLAAVCARSDRDGVQTITLEVRAGNGAARRLYQGHGFAVVAIRRGYYADDGEDAVVMIRPRRGAGPG